MTAPTLILSAPAGWGKTLHAPALQREHGCTSVVADWHPRTPLTPGALHLTHSHPADVESWGHPDEIIIGRGWPCKRDRRNPFARTYARAQAGGVVVGGLVLFVVMALGLALLMVRYTQPLDLAATLPDRRQEHTTAAQMEAAIAAEAAGLEQLLRQQSACGPNTGTLPRHDGSTECTDKRGRRTGVVLAGAMP